MALKPGSSASESPADENDELEVERQVPPEESAADRNAEAEQEVAETADPPDPDDGAETETPAKPAAKPAPKPSKPSPVDLAIERMNTPTEDPSADQPGARKATDPAKDKPKDGAATTPETPATGDDPQNDDKPKDEKPDPLHDWTHEERKFTKGRVKERFRKLHDEHEQAKPFVEVGRGWAEFTGKHQLSPDLQAIGDNDDALAVAIRSQAAVLRVAQAAREKRAPAPADMAWLQRNREAIDQVLGMSGHKAPTAPPEDLSKVEVTQEVRDLEAIGSFKSEDELRAVQAALNRVRGKKPAPAKPVDEQQVTPPATPPAPPAAPPERTVPWTVHDERLAKASIREDLVKAGIAREKIEGHFAANISPLIAKRLQTDFPGESPDAVWANLSPSSRREQVALAQSAWAARQKPATPARPPRAPSPPPVSGTGSRPPLAKSAATNGKGQVERTIAWMTGEEGD